jgi:DNA-binding PadR family transcriptional regulator
MAVVEEIQREKKIMKAAERAILRKFIDWIILVRLNKKEQSGYDIQQYVLKRYGVLIPSGTIYSKLYTYEKKGLMLSYNQSISNNPRRVYKLTPKGCKIVKVLAGNSRIGMLLNSIYTLECLDEEQNTLRKINIEFLETKKSVN